MQVTLTTGRHNNPYYQGNGNIKKDEIIRLCDMTYSQTPASEGHVGIHGQQQPYEEG